MFGLFKKKSSLPSILKLSDNDFVQAAVDGIKAGDPASGAMIAVAYMNLIPIIAVSKRIAEEKNDPTLPTDTDGFIKMLAEKQHEDEIGQRRTSWFFLAAVLMRATTLANKNKELENRVAEIWIHVAEGCRFLKNSLEHNVIWSANEKQWFNMLKDENDGIKYCVNHVMPKQLRANPAIKEFASKKGIFLSIF